MALTAHTESSVNRFGRPKRMQATLSSQSTSPTIAGRRTVNIWRTPILSIVNDRTQQCLSPICTSATGQLDIYKALLIPLCSTAPSDVGGGWGKGSSVDQNRTPINTTMPRLALNFSLWFSLRTRHEHVKSKDNYRTEMQNWVPRACCRRREWRENYGEIFLKPNTAPPESPYHANYVQKSEAIVTIVPVRFCSACKFV